jgi:hypothetical protein
MWRVFEKAGKPGWAAIIPIYNVWVLLDIVGRPGCLWMILLVIPGVNVIATIILMLDLAKSFGKDTLCGLGLILLSPIFVIHLDFSDSKYAGPAAV